MLAKELKIDADAAITLRGKLQDGGGVSLFDMQTTNRVTLCSISPIGFRATHKHLHAIVREDGEREIRNMREYVMPPVAKGKYELLTITDAFQRTLLPGAASATNTTPAPMNAIDIAQGLVGEWVLNGIDSNPTACLGLGILAGDEPTPQELTELNRIQTAYFEHLVSRAQQEYMAGNGSNYITQIHRLAADYLGRASILEWCGAVTTDDMVPCIACGQMMNGAVTMHSGKDACGQNLLEYIWDGNISQMDVRKVNPVLANKYAKYADRRRKKTDVSAVAVPVDDNPEESAAVE